MSEKYGARVVNLPPNVILVEQTKFSDKQGRYVIDHEPNGNKIERHVKRDDDHALAEAVRAALDGRLNKTASTTPMSEGTI